MPGCFFNALIRSPRHLEHWLSIIEQHNRAPPEERGDKLVVTGIAKYACREPSMGPPGFYLYFEHTGRTGWTSAFFNKRIKPERDFILYLFEDYQLSAVERHSDLILEASPGTKEWYRGIRRILQNHYHYHTYPSRSENTETSRSTL